MSAFRGHELLPAVKTFAILVDPADTTAAKLQLPVIQAAAGSLGLSLLKVNGHTPDEFERSIPPFVAAQAA
jgi:hypothetical protein